MEIEDIKEFLDVKYDQYNRAEFIETDPIRIPHTFSDPNDIEIAGFFAAIIANRALNVHTGFSFFVLIILNNV